MSKRACDEESNLPVLGSRASSSVSCSPNTAPQCPGLRWAVEHILMHLPARRLDGADAIGRAAAFTYFFFAIHI